MNWVLRWGVLVVSVFAGIAGLSGCGPKSVVAPLYFEATTVNLGEVDGETQLDYEFRFTVSAPGGIRVVHLRSSCDCTSASSLDLNRTLHRGQTGVIRLRVNQDRYGGAVEGSVHVETEPVSPLPIILSVRALARGKPKVLGPSLVEVAASIGTPASVEFDVIRHRPTGDKSLEPNWAKSAFGGFIVDRHEISESAMPVVGAQVEIAIRERHRFRLIRRPVSELGVERLKVTLAWKDCDWRTMLAVNIASIHPLEVTPRDVFVGFVKANDTLDLELSFVRRLDSAEGLLIEPQAMEDLASAVFNSATGRIHVSMVAPSAPGMFRRTWSIGRGKTDMPHASFSVAAIVEN